MRIILGVPSSGMISDSSATASFLASLKHDVVRIPSAFSGPNYNSCLCYALNRCEAGHGDLHAQIHADLHIVEEKETCLDCNGKGCWVCNFDGKRAYERWLDVLVEEMLKHDADFISVPMAIKNYLGVTSCGVGNPETRWNPWRRFCTNEFAKMPETFSAADIGYGDKYLIHNHAVCLFDLRKPIWRETDANGCLKLMFNFEEKMYRGPDGKWTRQIDSEDWNFSRRLWEIGAKTVITSRIKTAHHDGAISYANYGDWGVWKNGDEGTQSQWRKNDPLRRGNHDAVATSEIHS